MWSVKHGTALLLIGKGKAALLDMRATSCEDGRRGVYHVGMKMTAKQLRDPEIGRDLEALIVRAAAGTKKGRKGR